jgi:hypothetical protein
MSICENWLFVHVVAPSEDKMQGGHMANGNGYPKRISYTRSYLAESGPLSVRMVILVSLVLMGLAVMMLASLTLT